MQAMSEADWLCDDPEVPDEEELLRRIPWVPDHVGFDAQTGSYFPHPAAFRRGNPGEGMSVHMLSVIEGRGRAATDVHDSERFGTVAFLAGVPRTVGGGVVAIPATEDDEFDPVLREAHAEVRPPTYVRNRGEWSLICDTIIDACRWVVAPHRKPVRRGA